MKEKKLPELAERAFKLIDKAKNIIPENVNISAMPILYFGNVEKYKRSNRKIVTVGLNPGPSIIDRYKDKNKELEGYGQRDGYTSYFKEMNLPALKAKLDPQQGKRRI